MSAAPSAPDPAAVAAFWAACKTALPHLTLGDRYRTRCIGGSAVTNASILNYIVTGQKVGTFPLPWQADKTGDPLPKPGDFTIQLAFDGSPRVLVRTTSIETLRFKDITGEHTVIDGPPVRDINVWRPIHIAHYSQMLAALGLQFSEEMPVCVERFEYLHGTA